MKHKILIKQAVNIEPNKFYYIDNYGNLCCTEKLKPKKPFNWTAFIGGFLLGAWLQRK